MIWLLLVITWVSCRILNWLLTCLCLFFGFFLVLLLYFIDSIDVIWHCRILILSLKVPRNMLVWQINLQVSLWFWSSLADRFWVYFSVYLSLFWFLFLCIFLKSSLNILQIFIYYNMWLIFIDTRTTDVSEHIWKIFRVCTDIQLLFLDKLIFDSANASRKLRSTLNWRHNITFVCSKQSGFILYFLDFSLREHKQKVMMFCWSQEVALLLRNTRLFKG